MTTDILGEPWVARRIDVVPDDSIRPSMRRRILSEAALL